MSTKKEIVYFEDMFAIFLGVLAICVCVGFSAQMYSERNEANAKLRTLEIEYLRLKTAMAITGVEDYVEIAPNRVEVKMIKP